MDRQEAYAWGELFTRESGALREGMAERASALGLTQREQGDSLVWRREDKEECRWVFVDDPADLERIRAVYADDANTNSPACFVVVRQPDPSDDRGDIIFDIFRLSPQSYLWHFNRVYTPPRRGV
jgi:hypothetical protein